MNEHLRLTAMSGYLAGLIAYHYWGEAVLQWLSS